MKYTISLLYFWYIKEFGDVGNLMMMDRNMMEFVAIGYFVKYKIQIHVYIPLIIVISST